MERVDWMVAQEEALLSGSLGDPMADPPEDEDPSTIVIAGLKASAWDAKRLVRSRII